MENIKLDETENYEIILIFFLNILDTLFMDYTNICLLTGMILQNMFNINNSSTSIFFTN